MKPPGRWDHLSPILGILIILAFYGLYKAAPTVFRDIQSVEEFCRENQNAEIKLIFWEEEEDHRFADVSPQHFPRSIAFLTGPEGGFTGSEIQTARQHGFQSITLGPRVLRAETAPIVVLSLLQSRWGDL